jgi:hypothetical protein
LEDNYPPGDPPEDPAGDKVIDVRDLKNAPDPGACFDAEIDSFTYDDVDYKVYLTGFWEAGAQEPVGEGWSPEYDITHFEVRAEVWEADAASKRDVVKCVANPNLTSCDDPG